MVVLIRGMVNRTLVDLEEGVLVIAQTATGLWAVEVAEVPFNLSVVPMQSLLEVEVAGEGTSAPPLLTPMDTVEACVEVE